MVRSDAEGAKRKVSLVVPLKKGARPAGLEQNAADVQKKLHDTIMMDDLEEDYRVFSDGTLYADLDHGNDRCSSVYI